MIGLLPTAATQSVWAQALVKQHRIAVIIPAGPVAIIHDNGGGYWPAFFAELRRLGDIEGQNLSVERYSAEGQPEGLADLARDVVNRNPDLIVATTNPIALAARAAAGTIPIVWIRSEPIRAGLATSLARPAGNITWVAADRGFEIFVKQLQFLKEAVPLASKVAYLTITTVYGQRFRQLLREISQRLEISLIDLVVQESTPPEYKRVFAEIAREPVDAIIVSDIGDLWPYRQLIVDLVEKSRLPAMCPYRDYVQLGGLMAYASDFSDLGLRMADDVHQILNGSDSATSRSINQPNPNFS